MGADPTRPLLTDFGWDPDACAQRLREIEAGLPAVGNGDPMDYWRALAVDFAEAVRQNIARRIADELNGGRS